MEGLPKDRGRVGADQRRECVFAGWIDTSGSLPLHLPIPGVQIGVTGLSVAHTIRHLRCRRRRRDAEHRGSARTLPGQHRHAAVGDRRNVGNSRDVGRDDSRPEDRPLAALDSPEMIVLGAPLLDDLVLRDLQHTVGWLAGRGEGEHTAGCLARPLGHPSRRITGLDAREADQVELEVAVFGPALAGHVHIVGKPVENRWLSLALKRVIVDVGQVEQFVAIFDDRLHSPGHCRS